MVGCSVFDFVGDEGPSAPLFFKQLKLALGERLPVVIVSCAVFEFVGAEGPSAHLFVKQLKLALGGDCQW